MKRKVSRIGPATLCVSLPSKWTKGVGIKKGDEVEVIEKGNELILSTVPSERKEEKEITIDITSYNRYLLDRHLTVLYRNNYDKIILTYQKDEIKHENKTYHLQSYIKNLTNRFMGMEILSQTNKKTELACFILKDLQNVQAIEKRIYFLLKETMDNLIEATKHDFVSFNETVYDRHDNIVKFINYYLKIVDQLPGSSEEKKQIYAFYILIDKIVDKIRHLSERIVRFGYTEKVRKILEEIFALFYQLSECLHKEKFDIELLSRRYEIMDKIDSTEFTSKEMRILKEADLFLHLINDFCETIMIKQLPSAA